MTRSVVHYGYDQSAIGREINIYSWFSPGMGSVPSIDRLSGTVEFE